MHSISVPVEKKDIQTVFYDDSRSWDLIDIRDPSYVSPLKYRGFLTELPVLNDTVMGTTVILEAIMMTLSTEESIWTAWAFTKPVKITLDHQLEPIVESSTHISLSVDLKIGYIPTTWDSELLDFQPPHLDKGIDPETVNFSTAGSVHTVYLTIVFNPDGVTDNDADPLRQKSLWTTSGISDITVELSNRTITADGSTSIVLTGMGRELTIVESHFSTRHRLQLRYHPHRALNYYRVVYPFVRYYRGYWIDYSQWNAQVLDGPSGEDGPLGGKWAYRIDATPALQSNIKLKHLNINATPVRSKTVIELTVTCGDEAIVVLNKVECEFSTLVHMKNPIKDMYPRLQKLHDPEIGGRGLITTIFDESVEEYDEPPWGVSDGPHPYLHYLWYSNDGYKGKVSSTNGKLRYLGFDAGSGDNTFSYRIRFYRSSESRTVRFNDRTTKYLGRQESDHLLARPIYFRHGIDNDYRAFSGFMGTVLAEPITLKAYNTTADGFFDTKGGCEPVINLVPGARSHLLFSTIQFETSGSGRIYNKEITGVVCNFATEEVVYSSQKIVAVSISASGEFGTEIITYIPEFLRPSVVESRTRIHTTTVTYYKEDFVRLINVHPVNFRTGIIYDHPNELTVRTSFYTSINVRTERTPSRVFLLAPTVETSTEIIYSRVYLRQSSLTTFETRGNTSVVVLGEQPPPIINQVTLLPIKSFTETVPMDPIQPIFKNLNRSDTVPDKHTIDLEWITHTPFTQYTGGVKRYITIIDLGTPVEVTDPTEFSTDIEVKVGFATHFELTIESITEPLLLTATNFVYILDPALDGSDQELYRDYSLELLKSGEEYTEYMESLHGVTATGTRFDADGIPAISSFFRGLRQWLGKSETVLECAPLIEARELGLVPVWVQEETSTTCPNHETFTLLTKQITSSTEFSTQINTIPGYFFDLNPITESSTNFFGTPEVTTRVNRGDLCNNMVCLHRGYNFEDVSSAESEGLPTFTVEGDVTELENVDGVYTDTLVKQLDGNTIIEIPNFPAKEFYTFSVWCQPTENEQCLFYLEDQDSLYGMGCYISTSSLVIRDSKGSSNTFDISGIGGSWQRISIEIDTSSVAFGGCYFNGPLPHSIVIVGDDNNIWGENLTLRLFKDTDESPIPNYSGLVDEMQIFSVALSESQNTSLTNYSSIIRSEYIRVINTLMVKRTVPMANEEFESILDFLYAGITRHWWGALDTFHAFYSGEEASDRLNWRKDFFHMSPVGDVRPTAAGYIIGDGGVVLTGYEAQGRNEEDFHSMTYIHDDHSSTIPDEGLTPYLVGNKDLEDDSAVGIGYDDEKNIEVSWLADNPISVPSGSLTGPTILSSLKEDAFLYQRRTNVFEAIPPAAASTFPARSMFTLGRMNEYSDLMDNLKLAYADRGYTMPSVVEEAVNKFLITAYTSTWWAKLEAFYGLFGNSEETYGMNWKNPGTDDLSFTGEFVFSSMGAKPNGDNSYIRSNLVSKEDYHVSMYIPQSPNQEGYLFGGNSGFENKFNVKFYNGHVVGEAPILGSEVLIPTQTSSELFVCLNRTETYLELQVNDEVKKRFDNASKTSADPISFLAHRNENTHDEFSDNLVGVITAGASLTQLEMSSLNYLVKLLKNTL